MTTHGSCQNHLVESLSRDEQKQQLLKPGLADLKSSHLHNLFLASVDRGGDSVGIWSDSGDPALFATQ